MSKNLTFQSLNKIPNSIEAEIAVLGGLILDNESWEKIADILQVNDFYNEQHRKIYSCIVGLVGDNTPFDVVTINEKVNTSDDKSFSTYLSEIINQTPSAANIKAYANIVREQSILRQLISVSNNLIEKSRDGGIDSKSLLDEAERTIFNISEESQKTNSGFQDINKLVQESLKEIEKRAESVTKTYDDLIEMGYRWHLDKSKVDLYELKKKMYLAMVSVNILEGLRFYVSFACSFAFGELKLLEGSAKIISMIARDESQHLAMSQTIINNWHDRNDDKDMIRIRKECEKEVYKMYQESVEEEKRWATYLFSQGSMIGLSEKLLHQFVEYMANRRMKAIGLTPQYEQKTNPLPWVDHWLNSKGMQNAPQETEIESYVIGGIKQDVTKDQFKKFKL